MADDGFELKKLTKGGVPAAIEKAGYYRLLNEPRAAESICLDVLEVDPANQEALRTLVLALTDQFASAGSGSVKRAREFAAQLAEAYQREYFLGVICEREAKAYLGRGMSREFAYDGFRSAMEHYEAAEKIRPPDQDDPILRWNECVRILRAEGLKPLEKSAEQPLE